MSEVLGPASNAGVPVDVQVVGNTVAWNDGRRVALVTGAARGLGLAIARRLLQDGLAVALSDVDGVALADAVAGLREAGWAADGFVADVADETSVEALVATVAAKAQRLDVVVNNAGIVGRVDGRNPRVAQTPLAIWERTLAVNLTGAFLVSRAATSWLEASPAGRIVNIASRVARARAPSPAAYAASKAGLLALSRTLAEELGAAGVTVNCVAPGRIVTELTRANPDAARREAQSIANTPLGRLGSAEDVAGAVSYLVSPDAAFVTGTVLDVNGGMSMA